MNIEKRIALTVLPLDKLEEVEASLEDFASRSAG
jgi:hypothetical protein